MKKRYLFVLFSLVILLLLIFVIFAWWNENIRSKTLGIYLTSDNNGLHTILLLKNDLAIYKIDNELDECVNFNSIMQKKAARNVSEERVELRRNKIKKLRNFLDFCEIEYATVSAQIVEQCKQIEIIKERNASVSANIIRLEEEITSLELENTQFDIYLENYFTTNCHKLSPIKTLLFNFFSRIPYEEKTAQ